MLVKGVTSLKSFDENFVYDPTKYIKQPIGLRRSTRILPKHFDQFDAADVEQGMTK